MCEREGWCEKGVSWSEKTDEIEVIVGESKREKCKGMLKR